MGSIEERRNFLMRVENGGRREGRIRLVSAEKRKEKSKSRSGRKIQLTKCNSRKQITTCQTLPNEGSKSALSEITNLNMNRNPSARSIASQNLFCPPLLNNHYSK